jgi:hypothetical protein
MAFEVFVAGVEGTPKISESPSRFRFTLAERAQRFLLDKSAELRGGCASREGNCSGDIGLLYGLERDPGDGYSSLLGWRVLDGDAAKNSGSGNDDRDVIAVLHRLRGIEMHCGPERYP